MGATAGPEGNRGEAGITRVPEPGQHKEQYISGTPEDQPEVLAPVVVAPIKREECGDKTRAYQPCEAANPARSQQHSHAEPFPAVSQSARRRSVPACAGGTNGREQSISQARFGAGPRRMATCAYNRVVKSNAQRGAECAPICIAQQRSKGDQCLPTATEAV